MGIRAGRLRFRMTIQANTPTKNEYGEWTQGWAPVATVWADMWAKSGTERLAAKTVQAEVSHGVLMRPYVGLTTEHRLTMGARTFAITFINDTLPGQYTLDVTEKPGLEAQ